MAFMVFTVFIVCLLGTSLLMYLSGVVLDAVRGRRERIVSAAPETSAASIDQSPVSRPRKAAVPTGGYAPTFYLCR
jgi:hypothetical protein